MRVGTLRPRTWPVAVDRSCIEGTLEAADGKCSTLLVPGSLLRDDLHTRIGPRIGAKTDQPSTNGVLALGTPALPHLLEYRLCRQLADPAQADAETHPALPFTYTLSLT